MLCIEKILIPFKYSLLLLLLLLSFLIFVKPSYAEGKFVIKPVLDLSGLIDSNYHKSETEEKEVYTYSVKPGIEMGYKTDKTTLTVDYSIDILRYDDQDTVPPGSINADDHDYTGHQGILSLQSQVSDQLLVGIDDLYLKTRDPANADATSNAVDRFKYTINTFAPMMVYKFGEKFGMGLKYTNLVTDYDKDFESEDSTENRGTIDFYYYFNSQTSFDLNYQVWNRDYDAITSDYDSNQVMLNVNYQSNYFTFSAGAGYHTRQFDNNGLHDIDLPSWQVSVSGQNPPDAVGIPKSSLFVTLNQNVNDSGSGETYYTATRLDARLTHLFLEKLNLTLAGYFQNSDYETGSRQDDTWEISGVLDWLVHDYATLGIEAGHQERDSNQTGKDYDNDYIMLNLKLNYDFASK